MQADVAEKLKKTNTTDKPLAVKGG